MKSQTMPRPHLWLPALAAVLLLFGLIEHPRALEKMHRSLAPWWVSGFSLGMIFIAGLAAWIGGRSSWLDRLERVRPLTWIVMAIGLAIFPRMMGWYAGEQPVWKTGVPGIHVDAGLLSVLAFLGWIAALSDHGTPDARKGWWRTMAFVLVGLAWAWSVTGFASNSFAVIAALLVGAFMLRRTPWFRVFCLTAVVCSLALILHPHGQAYARGGILEYLLPFDISGGRNFAAFQVRKSLEHAGWFGASSFTYLPHASRQFMLASIGERWGWLGFLVVTSVATAALLLLRLQLRQLRESWLKGFSLSMAGFLLIGGVMNVAANLGLTGPAGPGIPFLSQNLLLAGIAAFLIGVAYRASQAGVSSNTNPPDPALQSVVSAKKMLWRVLPFATLVLLGLAYSQDISRRERSKSGLPLQARADIVDRNGVILATNEKRLAVWLDMDKLAFTDGRKLASLAKLIGSSSEEIFRRGMQYPRSSHLYIAYNQPMSLRPALEALNFPGMQLEEMTSRIYPKAPVVSDVLGFTTGDVAGEGLEGVELVADRRLARRHASQPTAPLGLYLDVRVQDAAWRALREVMNEHNAETGAAIVADREGKVIAMVSVPGFDPANRSTLNAWGAANHAVADHFPCDGLVPPIVRAAALSQGKRRPSPWWLQGKLHGLGFGQLPRIDGLPRADRERVSNGDDPDLPMVASLLQLAGAYLTLAGDGVPRQFQVIRDYRRPDIYKQLFNTETVEAIRKELKESLPETAAIPGVAAGGVAASAIQPLGWYYPRAVDAFVGLAPIEAPRFVVAVMLARSELRPIAGHPSTVAFSRIMRAAMEAEGR